MNNQLIPELQQPVGFPDSVSAFCTSITGFLVAIFAFSTAEIYGSSFWSTCISSSGCSRSDPVMLVTWMTFQSSSSPNCWKAMKLLFQCIPLLLLEGICRQWALPTSYTLNHSSLVALSHSLMAATLKMVNPVTKWACLREQFRGWACLHEQFRGWALAPLIASNLILPSLLVLSRCPASSYLLNMPV